MKKNIIFLLLKNSKQFMERKNFKRTIALSCLTAFLTVNTATSVIAMPTATMNNTPFGVESQNDIKQLKPSNPYEMKVNTNENVVHAKTLTEGNVTDITLIKPLAEENLDITPFAVQRNYTLKELSAMSYEEMVNIIVTLEWRNIDGLFTYSPDSQEFYGDSARVKYIINALDSRSKTFTPLDNKGIPTIVEVLRSGFYLGYYNTGLSYLNDRNFQDLCLPSLNSMLANPDFKFGNKLQNGVIGSFGSLIGNASCNAEVANKAAVLLKDYKLNMASYSSDLSKGNAIYAVIQGISYDFTSASYGKVPSSMPYYGKIDTLLNEFKDIALLSGVSSSNQWFVNNAIYQIGELGIFHSNPKMAQEVLTTVMDNGPKYSETFFIAAQKINYSYKGINSRGENINYAKLQEEGYTHYLPNKYTFDNGAIVMQVGSNVTQEKAKKLYWAAKEVEAQFFRTVGNDKALEPGNTDNVLTIKIFNSPKEYKMNQYLGNLSTDNGGIYIESTGTFYTYERTTQESIYSLEELFRHEFSHYLQGRYLVSGLWGQGPFYENEDLTWYEEGSAEFFAGGTRTDGIKPRKTIVNQLAPNEIDRFTLSKTVSSGYNSGWQFYNYGFALVSYMYNNDMTSLNRLHDSVMANDIKGYRAFMSELKLDSAKNTQYQQYMQKLIGDTTIGTPLVSDSYTAIHPNRTLAQISSDIISVSGMSTVTQDKTTSSDFNTFKISGKYLGGISTGRLQDNAEMNKTANEMLKNLSLKGWTGYETVTCYFTNYKVVNGNFEYDLVFKGLLNDNSIIPENKVPTANIDAPSQAIVNTSVQFNADKSVDTDGYIVSYAWDFGDNSISSSKNPAHSYSNEGTYIVTLKVTDDKGAISETKFNINIVPTPIGGVITSEIEPNNTNAQANSFIANNTAVTGSLKNFSDEDNFVFEVDTAGKVDIKITGSASKLTWVVYKSDNLNNYKCWKQYTQGDISSGSFTATTGKYYLKLYAIDGAIVNGNYSINITGIKSYTPNIQ
ncbi:MAG: collagenase [Clostridium sp.]|uniref:collagenase n=1 Tax=Clostridium sp. TaxID=1506 RepID=UPI00302A039F